MSEQTEEVVRRQRRRTLTDKQVAALPKKRERYPKADPELKGHYVRVMPKGANVFACMARNPYGKQVWHTLGSADVLRIEEAREAARATIKRIREGKPPVEEPSPEPSSFKVTAENWFKRVVEAEGFRTAPEIKRCLEKYIYPEWQDRPFASIRRSDIASLRDKITDDHGPRQATLCIGIAGQIANWFAEDSDDYVSPFIRKRQKRGKGRKGRSRVLDDAELVLVWKQAELSGSFGRLIQMLLLTAQRRAAVLGMKWSDIKDGTWEIAEEDDRAKGNAGAIKLPAQALAIINSQPRFAKNPYVFAAARGSGPMNGFSKAKLKFDKACGVTAWTLHDLRRTARSLMSKAQIPSDHAERVLGHSLGGIEAVYDRHTYFYEKSDALERLAALIDRILNPPPDNVTPLRRTASV